MKDVDKINKIECLRVKTNFHDLPLCSINRASRFFRCFISFDELNENQMRKIKKLWLM